MKTLLIIILILTLVSLTASLVGIYLWIKEEKKLEQKATKRTRITKKKYLDFVYLTDKEYNKLIKLFGEERAKSEIRKLNNYIGSSWKHYKNHYYTIRQRNPEVIEQDKEKDLKTKIEIRKWEILFLHNAGWRNNKIAERIWCTPQWIGKALKRRK
jgi:hypothetical protein